MIFFLNYDGTLTRQDTGRIYQGSTAVPEIKVLSGVSNASSVLQVAFTLPNGLTTQYFPLTQQGEYEQDGIKAFLWSLELATDILANVTEQVGKVGVSVRQVNVINNTVVASYTATFDVEYSALPYTPSEYTPADTQELIDLLGAYYNQNQTLIDSIRGDYESVVDRLDEHGEDITNLESDVDKLEELTDKPLLINITTDVETGVGTKYYNDGTTATFEIGTDVATSNRGNFMTEISFLSTSLNWTQEQDGTYSIVFSPATTERNDANCIVAVDRLDGNGYNQTANGVLKGSDGSLALYGVATPFDGKLLVLAGGGAGTKIWTLPVRVGEEISGLSFDTASTPDVYNDFILGSANTTLIKIGKVQSTLIQDGKEVKTTIDKGLKAQNLDDPPQAELAWFNPTFNEVIINQDENKYFVDGVEYTFEEASNLLADETIVYRDYEEFWQNNGKPTGWLVDELTFDKKYTIEEVNNQAKWGDYIGANDKSTLFEALIGDYYLEEATGEWYLCVGKTDTSIDWEYLFTSKVTVNLNGTQTSKPMFFAPTTTREANKDGSCWVLTPNGNTAPEWGQMTLETADNLTYTIKVGGKNVGSFTLTKEVFLDSVSYNPETKKLTFTYNTESGKASVDIDLSDLEEVQNALIATNETEFLAYQTEENIGKLVTYRGLLYIITESTPTPNAPIAVGDTIDKLYFNTSVTPDFSNITSWDKDGMCYFVYCENGTPLGLVDMTQQGGVGYVIMFGDTFLYASEELSSAFMEEWWGEAITIPQGWNADLKANGGVLTFDEADTVSEINDQSEWSSYISKEPFTSGGGITAKLVNEINSITCDGTNFHFSYKVGENEAFGIQVPIDYVDAELVEELSYNDLTDKPILIGDLDTITPVANTYYKHNGASETTYTKGVIYFYDGSVFKPVTGGGGGVSDVQINGASIVADGVANIPYASDTQKGVINTSSQNIKGNKIFQNSLEEPSVSFVGNDSGILRGQSNFMVNKRSSYLYSILQTTNHYIVLGGLRTNQDDYKGFWIDVRNGRIAMDCLFTTERYSPSWWSTLPDYRGTLLSAPSTWSTGTSGSVTLPSAGLYEVKVGDVNVVHAILYWDGTLPSNELLGPALLVSVGAGGLVTISEQGTGTQQTTTISYRKIGIA